MDRPVHTLDSRDAIATLHGRVVELDTGRALPGAAVSTESASTTADAAGHYEITAELWHGEASVRVTHPGYIEQSPAIRVHGSRRVELDLVLQPAARLRVQVVDAASGEPVAGAEARHHAPGEVLARSDADGCFVIDVAEGTQLKLVVGAEGRGTTTWLWTVHDAASTKACIPLLSVGTIAGVVTDAEGKPIEHADVYGPRSDPRRPREMPTPPVAAASPGTFSFENHDTVARTDARGRFALAVLPDALPQTVGARHAEYVACKPVPVVVDRAGAQAWVTLTLERGAIVRGTVRCSGNPWLGQVLWRQPASRGFGGSTAVTTFDDYVLRVAAGDVILTLRGFDGHEVRTATLHLEPGQDVRHDFVWEEKAIPITGRVTSSTGKALSGILVQARLHGSTGVPSFRASTNAEGRYSIACTEAGTYSISAHRGAVSRERENVPAGTSDVDLVLPELGRLRLQLLDAATREPARVQSPGSWSVAWRESGQESFANLRDKVDHTGLVELRLPVGTVDLSLYLHDSGYVPRSLLGVAVTTAADAAPIPVELVRGTDVEFELSSDTPMPADVAKEHLVFCVDERQSALLRGPFPEQGGESNHRINGINMWLGEPGLMNRLLLFGDSTKVPLNGLAPGRHWLRAFPDDLLFEPASFDVPPPDGKIVVRWRRR